MFIYFICDLWNMSFFENMGTQTEMIIFLKSLLKFGMEIDKVQNWNKYL